MFSATARSSVTRWGNALGQIAVVCGIRLWFGKAAEVTEPEPDRLGGGKRENLSL